MNRRPWTADEEATFIDLHKRFGTRFEEYLSFFHERSIKSIKSFYYRHRNDEARVRAGASEGNEELLEYIRERVLGGARRDDV